MVSTILKQWQNINLVLSFSEPQRGLQEELWLTAGWISFLGVAVYQNRSVFVANGSLASGKCQQMVIFLFICLSGIPFALIV